MKERRCLAGGQEERISFVRGSRMQENICYLAGGFAGKEEENSSKEKDKVYSTLSVSPVEPKLC